MEQFDFGGGTILYRNTKVIYKCYNLKKMHLWHKQMGKSDPTIIIYRITFNFTFMMENKIFVTSTKHNSLHEQNYKYPQNPISMC